MMRDGGNIEHRYRDIQVILLHVIAHQDRVCEQAAARLPCREPANPF